MIRRSLANVFSLVNLVRGGLFGRSRIEAPGGHCDLPDQREVSPVDAAIIAGLFARCRWN